MILDKGSDQEWERYGKESPYYGVLTDEKYINSHNTQENLDEFFTSGETHVAHVLDTIKKRLNPEFAPSKVLDFGCGVGRLTIPFARLADQVTGLDVSDSMLQEAASNCQRRSIDNTSFEKSDDGLSRVSGKFDLIHSYIVFQHIPVPRGEALFSLLVDRLESGGVGVVHFTYAKSGSNIVPLVKKYLPFTKYIANLVKGRPLTAPHMEMNSYNINRLTKIIQQNNVSQMFVEFTDHDHILGVIFYFIKS